MTADQARATVQSLVDMAIRKMPREYRGKKDWEKTKRVWGGLNVRREGLRLKTNRRWREVRHGLQSHYVVSFPGAATAPPPLRANVRSVTPTADAWQIQSDVASPLDFTARIERWNRGVRIYSVEVKGFLKVRLDLTGTLAAQPDYSEVPPAIVIRPKVTAATLHLDSLEVDRVSKIGGEVAEQWGEIAENIVQQILLDDINQKLPSRLNRAIEKKQDELRFSALDWFEKLTNSAG